MGAVQNRCPRSPSVARGPVRIELPVPFALKTVNAWVFPGAEAALVDCGTARTESYERLLRGLEQANVRPNDVRLFITHGHVDHAGAARRLRDDHGVRLHAPRIEAPFVETFRADGPARNGEYEDALVAHGMPAETLAAVADGSRGVDSLLDDSPIDADVPNGERVVLGDMEATAVHVPGHTPGSVAFHLTEDNHLLSGDTLLQHITSNAGELRDADRGAFHQYVATLDDLRRFVGVDCLPGHHDAFRLTDGILDTHLESHRQRRARILAELARPLSAWQLFARIFPHKNDTQNHFLGMAELVGHLHSMEMDGLVRRDDADGLRRFVAA